MNEDYEKEILKLFEGDVNQDAIREYLAVEADESLIYRAYDMIPKPTASSPSEAMASAIKITADLKAEQESQLLLTADASSDATRNASYPAGVWRGRGSVVAGH